MTTMNLEPVISIERKRSAHMYESVSERVSRVSSFVIDRLTLNSDHQMAQNTTTPLFFHESYGYNQLNIVLGEE